MSFQPEVTFKINLNEFYGFVLPSGLIKHKFDFYSLLSAFIIHAGLGTVEFCVFTVMYSSLMHGKRDDKEPCLCDTQRNNGWVSLGEHTVFT